MRKLIMHREVLSPFTSTTVLHSSVLAEVATRVELMDINGKLIGGIAMFSSDKQYWAACEPVYMDEA